ncbi:PH domain-containing protein [Acidaminobacterium chupaoyuni]
MGLMDKLGGSVIQGVLGNMSEISPEALQKEYGAYLMDGETIQTGFKLVRDAMIITDKRILEFDKQGATGQKMRVNSIYLNSIFGVSAETAGFGIDDSELEIYYIQTPYMKAHGIQYANKKFEFPKKYNIQSLYKMLQELAYDNYQNLNK